SPPAHAGVGRHLTIIRSPLDGSLQRADPGSQRSLVPVVLFNLTKVTLQSRSHDMDSHTFDPSTNGRAAPRRCAPAQTDEIEKSSHRPTAVGQPSRRWAM